MLRPFLEYLCVAVAVSMLHAPHVCTNMHVRAYLSVCQYIALSVYFPPSHSLLLPLHLPYSLSVSVCLVLVFVSGLYLSIRLSEVTTAYFLSCIARV